MPVEDFDLFLVNRNGSSYYVAAEDFADKVQDDDLLLVNRNGQSYKVQGADIKDKLEDDDWMLANRNGVSYKVSGADVKDIFEIEIVQTNRPGVVYNMKAGQTLAKDIANQPVLIINAYGNYTGFADHKHFFVGQDGKIYYVFTTAMNTMSPEPTLSSVTNAKKIFANGNAASEYTIVYQSDGTVAMGRGIKNDPLFPTAEQGNFIDILGNGRSPVFGMITEDKCYVNIKSSPTNVPAYGSLDITTRDVWLDSGIQLPAGEKLKKVCPFPTMTLNSSFGIFGLAILAQSGNLYTAFSPSAVAPDFAGAPPATGRNGSPLLWLADIKDVNYLYDPSRNGGLTVIKKDGTLWYGTNTDHINKLLPAGRAWGEITAGGNDYRSTIYYCEASNETWGIVKKDGKIYRPSGGSGASASDDYVELDYQGFPAGALTGFGALPQTMGQNNPTFYIIPPA